MTIAAAAIAILFLYVAALHLFHRVRMKDLRSMLGYYHQQEKEMDQNTRRLNQRLETMVEHGAKVSACALEAQQSLEATRNAIRSHRDQRGDDRCWMDDETLYQMLPEGYTVPVRDSLVMLENCRRFIACRKHPATEYVSPEREIERLKKEQGELRGIIQALTVELDRYQQRDFSEQLRESEAEPQP